MALIKRTVVTSTIHRSSMDESGQLVQAEPLVLTGDFSDRTKAQKAINKKELGFIVTSVETSDTVYALDLDVFMAHATIVEKEEQAPTE